MTYEDPIPADSLPWEALERLAAGELPPSEAEALQAEIAADARLQAAYAEVQEVEDLLRSEPMLPVPLPLVRSILARVAPTPRARPLQVLARVAASVLVFLSAWLAFSGSTPALADMGPPKEVTTALSTLPETLPVTAEASALLGSAAVPGDTTGALLATAAGLLILVLGVVLGLRAHAKVRAQPPTASAKE